MMNLNELTALRAEIRELKEKAAKAAKEDFNKYSQELFVSHPNLESFSWTQYTPYFNDGDECVFSARTDYIDVEFDGEVHEGADKYDLGTGYGKEFKYHPDLSEYQKALKDILEFLSVFENQDFKDIFGDHVRVVVSKNGADTDYYDHD